MHTKIVQLRVKIRSLTQEARLIRQEENRALCRIPLRVARDLPADAPKQRPMIHWRSREGTPDKALYVSLSNHRRREVRWAAREALLTYACLRGRPYAQVEPCVLYEPYSVFWENIRKGAVRFGVCYVAGETGAAFKVRQEQQARDIEAWIQAAQAHVAQQFVDQPAKKVQAA